MKIPELETKHYKRKCEYKRLKLVCSILKKGDRVLDVGCGVGNYISNPLSWLPVKIIAIDSDKKTIEYAREHNKKDNLEYIIADGETYGSDELFDAIICSNVLEHMREPMIILNNLRTLLKKDGLLYLGIPNGFGAFEIQNYVPRMLYKTKWGKRFVDYLRNGVVKDTLNIESQHIQFFKIPKIKKLLKECGWEIVRQYNDEILGGIIFDRIIPYITKLAEWNVELADYIPAQLANGWIFICQKS